MVFVLLLFLQISGLVEDTNSCFVYDKPPSKDPQAIACQELLEFCGDGNINKVLKGLQHSNFDLNCIGKDGYGCLHLATQKNQSEFLKEILERNSHSIFIDIRVGRNTTLNDDCELGENLEYDHYTSLMIASEKGHTDIARLLVNYGADPTLTALMEDSVSFAAWRGHLEIVKLLYETGKLDLTDQNPLEGACSSGHLPIAQYLIETQRLKPNHLETSLDVFESSPIENTARGGSLPVAEYLVSKGANPRAKDDLPLYLSSLSGHPSLLKYFLSVGGSPDAHNRNHYSALIAAIYSNSTECVEILIAAGAHVVAPSNSNLTLLHPITLRSQPNIDMFKLLLRSGADPNERDQWGNSILMIISRTGHYDLLMVLLEGDQTPRIDFHYQNPTDGYNALLLAALWNRFLIVKELCRRGIADPNARNSRGSTPLLLASAEGNLRIVQYLVEKCKADATLRNNYGKTALDWAKKSNHAKIVSYLQRHQQQSKGHQLFHWRGRT